MSRPTYSFTVLDQYPASVNSLLHEKKQKLFSSTTPYKIVPPMTVAPKDTIEPQVTIFKQACCLLGNGTVGG